MTSRRLSAALALCAGLAAGTARASTYQCPDSSYDVNLAVVYANGMFTKHRDAVENLAFMRPLITERLGHDDPDVLIFGLAYNADEGAGEQLWDVARERVSMEVSEYVRIMNGLVPMPDWLSEEIAKYAAELDLVGFVDDEALESHVQMYRDHLRKGHQVVVLAHSQGNLYSNAAYRQLFETDLVTPGKSSFGIVSVATPATEVAGGGPPKCPQAGCYTTFEEDFVMAAVRTAFPTTLPANINGQGLFVSDGLWHGLLEAYFALPHSRKQILDHVAAHVSAFEELVWTIHEGMISVSLEWNTGADLDLHVYEHGARDHVYYAYPEGEAGYLDADDADGYGPENYYAECSEVSDGRFRIAAGYWDGSGPVTATLRVQAGGLVRTFTKTLTEAQGRLSHTEPIPIADIEVFDFGEGSYDLYVLSAED